MPTTLLHAAATPNTRSARHPDTSRHPNHRQTVIGERSSLVHGHRRHPTQNLQRRPPPITMPCREAHPPQPPEPRTPTRTAEPQPTPPRPAPSPPGPPWHGQAPNPAAQQPPPRTRNQELLKPSPRRSSSGCPRPRCPAPSNTACSEQTPTPHYQYCSTQHRRHHLGNTHPAAAIPRGETQLPGPTTASPGFTLAHLLAPARLTHRTLPPRHPRPRN